MTFSIRYKTLFKVDLLHLYFLNRGVDEFFSMNEPDRIRQLDDYDIQSFCSILPTAETKLQLNGHNLLVKNLKTGFTVWSKVTENDQRIPFISLDKDLSFTFLIQLKHFAFYNFTNLKLEDAGKLYYFSNRQLSSESVSFPLINVSGDNHFVDDKFILSDTPAKAELKQLAANEKENLLGIIRIAVKADNNLLSVTDTQDKIQDPAKTFEIVLNNRKTSWRYLFSQEQKVKNKDDVKVEDGNARRLITKTEQPLTQKGFISIELDGKELPNPDARLITTDTSNKYYSEIYM